MKSWMWSCLELKYKEKQFYFPRGLSNNEKDLKTLSTVGNYIKKFLTTDAPLK